MIAPLHVCERQECRGKEHGFIIGMGDQETDAFVAEFWKGRVSDVGGVEPCSREEDGDYGDSEVNLHHGGQRTSLRMRSPELWWGTLKLVWICK